jgi:hypothetical protein
VTYNSPGNAFNLKRVTMKLGERLGDYTNWFFKNRNTCVGVRDDQSGATTVTPLMEVVNKLINTKEALVN